VHARRTWGSLCSGSEGAHYVVRAAEAAIGQWNAALGQEPLHLDQLFACENVPMKRKWIDHVVNGPRRAKGHKLICIFIDILHVGQRTAFGETHGQNCEVPGTDFVFASTSCRDLSLLSSAARKFIEPVLEMETSPGGSADTFAGFMAYLDAHPASSVIYENSDQMVDDHSAPLERTNEDVFNSKMSSRGYEGHNFIINAKLYGLPQNRRRFFAVYIRTVMGMIDFSTRTVLDQIRTMTMLLQCCKRACPPARDLLLSDDDEVLQAELLTLLEKPERTAEKPSWQVEHQKEYVKVNARFGRDSPCEATRDSPWLAILNGYQRSVLTLNQLKVLGKNARLYASSGLRPTASGQHPTDAVQK